MRKLILTLFLASAGFAASGQYIPNSGQTFRFSGIINPAFSGVENFGDLVMSYRSQWSGFGSAAPKYLNLSYNTRLKHPTDLRHNAVRISRPSLIQPESLPRGKRIIHGFGVNAFQSKIGVINSVGGSLNYAFNYPLSKKMRLSAGASSLVENRKLRLDGITFNEENDPFYNHLLGSASSQVDLSVRAGLLLYSKGFYLGASWLSLMNKPIQASDIALEEVFYKGSIQTGFAVQVGPTLTWKPSVLALILADNSFVIDYNLKAYLEDKGWVGLTYRDSGSGILSLGMNVSHVLHASYSYEMGFGGFQPFGGSSHEIVLGFRINNLKKENSWVW
jgi:type IX secretion system PorP/SprF family membrane protein